MLKCKLPWSPTWATALVGLWLIFTVSCSSGPEVFDGNSQVSESGATHHPSQLEKQRTSQYLTMRDGIQIAVDLYLPDNFQPGQKIPAILHQTRYWRAVDYRWLVGLFKEDRPRGIIGGYATRFLQEGYAWVDVDVRGSGASFGSRPVAYSPEEIQDGAEIVDWIIAQPWSNGKVGAMGISYSGGTAEMLLVNQHPAVEAVVPMFSGFDLYSEIAFPGGIHLNWFTKTWTTINNRLDNNELPFGGWMANLSVRGVRPVDHDAGDQLLSQAIKNHAANWSPYREASGITFRDDPPPSRHAPNIDALSTKTYADRIAESGAAIYSYSGWFDGGYQLAAIKRHLRHRQNPDNKLILGPWDHGGKRHISPESLGPATFDHAGELLKFFDKHLKGIGGDLPDDPPVRYYTMGEEQWKTATRWPPESTITPLYFQAEKTLSPDQPQKHSKPDRYEVNVETGTGPHSRWNTLVGISLKNPYPDRMERDRDLLVYTSEPLPKNTEVTGHPVATIYLSSSTPDTNLFVYLEDVTPVGDVHYVTEGQLRALHRKWSSPENGTSKSLPIPHRTFRRADAASLQPGEVVPLTIDLLPTSYQFKQGHRIRVALAGADKDHFQALDGPAPAWEIWRTLDRPSHINLPVVH